MNNEQQKPEGFISWSKNWLKTQDDEVKENRDLEQKAESSFAKAKKIREQSEKDYPKFGVSEKSLEDLTKEQQAKFYRLHNETGDAYKALQKIPANLVPKVLQTLPEYFHADYALEHINAARQNGEDYLNIQQKGLSKRKAADESSEKELAFNKKIEDQKNKIQSQVSKPQSIEDEYAGMTPDQIIAHYNEKYKTPFFKKSTPSKKTINSLDDEINQMAASKLGRKWDKNKGLY